MALSLPPTALISRKNQIDCKIAFQRSRELFDGIARLVTPGVCDRCSIKYCLLLSL